MPESAVPLATVLVVDDTPGNIDILQEILAPTYRVKVAASGLRALEAALGPLRGPIEAYNYPLALERLPAFVAATARPGAAGTSAGIPPR